MQQAALLLVGKHDFKNFSTVKKSKSTVREILDIDIYGDIEEMQITLRADDFLHNMNDCQHTSRYRSWHKKKRRH